MVAMDRSHVDLARLLLRAGAKTSTYIREILSYGDIGFECDGDTDCINNDEQQLKCKSGICRQQEPQRKTVSLSATKLNRGSNIEQKQRLSRLDEVLDGMSVIELKKYITAAGLSYSDCVGKKSLHIRAREAIALISPKTDAQSVVWQQKMLENPQLFKSAEAIAHAKTNYEEDPIAYLRYLENHHDIAQMVELSNPGFLAKYGIKRPTLKVTKEAPITGEILDAMSVKELKQYISAAGLLYSDCVEKKELHARAREASVQIMNRARDLTRNDDIEPPEFLATTSESSSPTAACGAENEEQEEVKGEPDTCNLAKWREEIRQMHKGSVGPVKGFGMQMMVACLHGYEHIVKELVNTMFGLAVKNKGEILDNLVDKNTTSPSFGLNPMGQAAQMGYINIVELLIAAGANPNCTKSVNQSSAIFLASLNGHAKLVWTLTERHHVITTGQTAHGSTPLMAAASGNHSNVVRVLLNSWDSNAAKHNINVVEHHSEGKDSALHIAARSGHANVADLLVNAGAHINLLDSTGSTPLFGALENDHPDVAQILVDAGAKLDLQNNDGSTALMKLAFNREGSDIEGGPGNPNPDWQPQPGRRQDSNHAKHIAAAKIVIDAGADLDKVRPDDGMTALMLAAYQGDVSIVKLLLEGNAAIHIRTLPQTDFVYGPPGEATAKEIAQLAADSSWGNAGNRMVERMIAREERRRRRKKKARPVRTQANKQTAAEYPEVANAAKRLQESMLKLLETMDYLLTDNSVLEQGRVKKKRS
jgi:ankyrin repeat protein